MKSYSKTPYQATIFLQNLAFGIQRDDIKINVEMHQTGWDRNGPDKIMISGVSRKDQELLLSIMAALSAGWYTEDQ